MEILVHSGKLFNGLHQTPIENSGLYIKDGIIKVAGKNSELPNIKEALRIDATGSTIIPGLINCHTHITRRHLHKEKMNIPFRFGAVEIEALPDPQRISWALSNSWYELFRGTTSFRDTGCKNRVSLQLRKVFENKIFNGPTVVSSGTGLAITGGHGTHGVGSARYADGVEEVRKAVRQEINAGVDWIKLMASGGLAGLPDNEDPEWIEYSIEELKAGVVEAHKRNRKVLTHCGGAESIKNSVIAGVDSIEHGMMMDEEGADMMVKNNVYYVPTVSGIKKVYLREKEKGSKDLAEFIYKKVILPHEESVKMANEKGIKIAAGTDTLGTMVDEIKLLKEYGLDVIGALCAATSNASEAIGLQDKVGTLEPGKYGDFIIVEGGDLFKDLDLLNGKIKVFKSGNLVTGDWLVNVNPN